MKDLLPTDEATTRPAAAAAGDVFIDLAGVDGKMLSIVGGKAGTLGELIRAGLPVPPGFCVTTEAYRQVAETVFIDFDAFSSTAPGELQRLAGKARDALLSASTPGSLAAAIIEAYNRLGDDAPVAVRSSATAEDLPFASFAGQQDTYLNIVGATAVLNAVQRCWASLWTDRAVVYRATNGIDPRTVRLAVVVQRMVDAEVAGVLFTANPVSGHRRQAVIDASPGLGEAVVSGSVNPDHFVVDTDTGKIVQRRLGDKRFEIRSLPGGGTRHVEKESGSDKPCVSDEEVRKLTALGDRVQTLYGAPQDIEWAIDASRRLWLTQARPITTLFPLPARAKEQQRDYRVYFCFSVAQGLNRPLTPMGLAGARVIASSAARLFGIPVANPLDGPPAFAEAAQRIFIDLTSTLRGPVGSKLMPAVLDMMEARSAVILRQLQKGPELAVTKPSKLPFVRRVLGIAIPNAVPLRALEGLFRPEAARARVKRLGQELAARLAPSNARNPAERLDFVERVLGREIVILGPRTMPAAGLGLAMTGIAGKLLGGDAQPDEVQTVLRGLPHNVTTEMDLKLWELAASIRAERKATQLLLETPVTELARLYRDGGLPEPAQSGLAGFLAEYGHRAVAEIDIGMPRWSDDPSHILGVLANYLRLEKPELAPDALFKRGAAEAEAMLETLAARAQKRGRLRGWAVRLALRRARQLAGLREMPKYNMIRVVSAVRRELAEVGGVLVERGAIQSADDVFFLSLAEARAALDGRNLRSLIVERRQLYEAELRRRHVPRVLLSDGTEPEARATAGAASAALTGTPASAGSVTGIARVVLDPVGAHLEPGEILVAPSTDPGWTPLFLTAGGLVMEMGGANSHGAVVAREYGIPAVVGVADATLRIETGNRITVDGSSGIVSLPTEKSIGPATVAAAT